MDNTQIMLMAAVIWEMVWKGLALWKAASNKHKIWFVIIFIINTVGILPILYLLYLRFKHKLGFLQKFLPHINI